MTVTDTTAGSADLPHVTPTLHHIGIQTGDLDNSEAWYQDFFGCRRVWSLDHFSEMTTSRLPGIVEIRELSLETIRFHLFGRPGRSADPSDSLTQFQHVCLEVATVEDLVTIRRRWLELHRSGRYEFALDVEPTEIVVDDDGTGGFYLYDVNGLEFEFTCPGGDRS